MSFPLYFSFMGKIPINHCDMAIEWPMRDWSILLSFRKHEKMGLELESSFNAVRITEVGKR